MTEVNRDAVPNWRSRRFWLKPEFVISCMSCLSLVGYLIFVVYSLEWNWAFFSLGLAIGLNIACLTVQLLPRVNDLPETKSAISPSASNAEESGIGKS